MADRSRSSAWQHVAGVAPLDELSMMAAHALADGDDSPALRELAGLSRHDDPAEIRELYDRALSERRHHAGACSSAWHRSSSAVG
ncbi:hypothetical protein ABZ461_25535 [Actinacidiphila glaucinigra]|uniref:hypothetical protein n=1 Tax=Actinacidiphila glaucinigra TaxID=235986 RepID=UPI0034054DAB